MEEMAVKGKALFAPAVHLVANNGIAKVSQVNPNLVCPAGEGPTFYQRKIPDRLQQLRTGLGRPGWGGDVG